MITIEMEPAIGAGGASMTKATSRKVTITVSCDCDSCNYWPDDADDYAGLVIASGPMRLDQLAALVTISGVRAAITPHGWKLHRWSDRELGEQLCTYCPECKQLF